MPPKTERFEMRMDEEVLDQIDRWRGDQDDIPSRSEAVRRLVEIGLSANSKKDISISDGEKLILAMLRDIVKGSRIKDPEIDPDFVMETLWGGHNWALEWQYTGLFHNYQDKRSTVSFVVDVLDMWSFLEEAYATLSEADKARIEREVGPWAKRVQFTGFDGNNEAEYIGVARCLVEKLDRFTRFKGRDFNSHYPHVAVYGGMYRAFEPIRKTLIGHGLNADQIIEILKARGH